MVVRINFDMIYRYSHNPNFNYFDIRFRDKAVYGISLNNKTSSHDKLSILVIIEYRNSHFNIQLKLHICSNGSIW